MNETRARVDQSLARAILRLGIFDLTAMAAASFEWLGMGLADAAPFLVASLFRVPVWTLLLWRLMAPARAWRVKAPVLHADERVLRTDADFQRLPDRFAMGYVCTWVLAECGVLAWCLVLAGRGSPGLATVDLLAGLLLMGSIVWPSLVLLPPLLEGALRKEHIEVSAEIVERELDSGRRPRSIHASIAVFGASVMLGVVFAVMGAGCLWHAERVREAAVAEQLRRAEVGALRFAATGELPETLRLVEPGLAPSVVLAALAAREDPESGVGFYDAQRDRVFGAATLRGGEIVIAWVEPDLDLLSLFSGMLLTFGSIGPAVWLAARLQGRRISERLETLRRSAQRFVEEGELRALERIVPLHDDEIGRLALQFNGMLDMLTELNLAAETVAQGDLRVHLARPGELHEAFRGMIARLGEAVWELRETSLELGSAAVEIHDLSRRHDDAARHQAVTVRQIEDSVGSLAASASRIAETARGVLLDADRSVVTTDEMIARISALRSQTASIDELLEVIREIADRSDLLALNGSLEAVRAGEVGRGFAIVAAEMRRLAEQVAGALDDVRGRVANIEAAGAGTVAATEGSRALAERTASAARSISELTREQSDQTEQASQGMHEVAEAVASTVISTAQTRSAAEGLRVQANRLEALLARFEMD
ncbi:methyl-accepting chemotaxis protein [Pseudenhygromyxa sp. WMMC2535]|uniref:methyl-accepting chemotaxis protein n=1 Tax=Pseudenhygromyxa sp. WMMC2535 TaxID=2712867 RepID=UPI001553CC77|nr:methyl-accepting chemotaxis protein [Pseudenhygromyxa sp. WMMC2535]NVB43312.1 methyl-accepting chemotaxis protein [Pseudenhygromyxa sp. WMMC2535]